MSNPFKRTARKLAVKADEFRICIKEFLSGGTQSLEYEILVSAHSIEKGLGLKDVQPGHSFMQVLNLIELMENLPNPNCFAYREAYQILTVYIGYQMNSDFSDSDELTKIIARYKSLTDGSLIPYQTGSMLLSREELESGKNFDLTDFLSSRHSIRSFCPREVPVSELLKAVEIANKAPSACNRQPHQVYFCNSPEKAKEFDALISGSNGFKGEISNYALITEDKRAFKGEEELQWYINGGIYASFFILALHSLGIGSCTMQWKSFNKEEKVIKALAGIPDGEAIIVVIGLGYYQDETKCLCAQRKATEDTLHVIK